MKKEMMLRKTETAVNCESGGRMYITALYLLALVILLSAPLYADPDVPGLYEPDEHTLHLWHFQESESGNPYPDFAQDPADPNYVALTDIDGVRDAESFYGCGNAFKSSTEGDKNTPKGASTPAPDLQSGYQGDNGAFTVEAIIKVDDLNGIQQIFSREGNGSLENRSYQFRINSGSLQFEGLSGNSNLATIPTSGPHAFNPDLWFHAAAAYEGNGSGKIYWTRLSPQVTVANEIGVFTLPAGIPATKYGHTAVAVHRRSGYRDPLHGLIDEVRISDIARAADDYIFPVEFPPGAKATNPSPADMERRVSPDVALSWLPPSSIENPTYNVRLGADPVTDNNPVIATGLTEPLLDVAVALGDSLAQGAVYYWRVDVENGDVFVGDDWSFTTYKIPVNLSGPYTVDNDTLHLWSFETDPNFIDSVYDDPDDPNRVDLADVYGIRADSSPGFGKAFKTDTHVAAGQGAASVLTDLQSKYQGADGAFTYEAIIKVDDLTGAYGTQRIISRTSVNNAFQFVINNGNLAFDTAGDSGSAPIPTEGAHAFVSSRRYHAAVTYDGEGQGKLYWTEMLSGANRANEIGAFTMADIPGDISSVTILAARKESNNQPLVGLIDEVRISIIARDANDFLFSQGPDLDDDGAVDLADFSYFAAEWLATGSELKALFNDDDAVDLIDLSIFVEYWLNDFN